MLHTFKNRNIRNELLQLYGAWGRLDYLVSCFLETFLQGYPRTYYSKDSGCELLGRQKFDPEKMIKKKREDQIRGGSQNQQVYTCGDTGHHYTDVLPPLPTRPPAPLPRPNPGHDYLKPVPLPSQSDEYLEPMNYIPPTGIVDMKMYEGNNTDGGQDNPTYISPEGTVPITFY